MPRRWKRFEDYSISAQNKTKRQCRPDDTSDSQLSSDGSDVLNQVELTSDQEDSAAEERLLEINDSLQSRASADNVVVHGESDENDFEDFANNSVSDNTSNFDDDTDSEDDESIPAAVNNADEPLYDGCPITVAESLIAILNLSLRHNITGDSFRIYFP